MKRRAFQIVVLLLLLGGGAIVNVAVAWGCIHSLKPNRQLIFQEVSSISASESHHLDLWQKYFSDGWPPSPSMVHVSHDGGVARLVLKHSARVGSISIGRVPSDHELRETYRGLGTFEVEEIRCGFPQYTLMAVRWQGMPWDRDLFRSSAGDDRELVCGQRIPSRIIVPGFAINTFFYAAMLWVVFVMPSWLSRKRRLRRGLCPACAYPVGTSPVCTECGKALTR